MDISYTPEKIDEFVAQAQKSAQTAEGLFRVFYSNLMDINIRSITENIDSFQEYTGKIRNAYKTIDKKTEEYSKIVDMYSWDERPDNVRQLDKLVDRLDNASSDISKLYYAAEEILAASKDLTGQYFNI